MKTKQIAITGVDGTGKTTLIRMLSAKYANDPLLVQVFRCPQYHEFQDAPFAELSQTLETLSALGDEWNDPSFKISALFVAISLYGSVQDFYERTYRPKFLFTERQPVVDTFAYTVFYKKLLTAPLSRSVLEPKLIAAVGQAKMDSIHRWMKVLETRSLPTSHEINFWNLPKIIFDLVDQKPEKMFTDLKRVYQNRLPDLLIVLQVDAEDLEKRQLERTSDKKVREMHEKKPILTLLNQQLLQGVSTLKNMEPSLEVKVLNTSHLSLDDTLTEIEKSAGLI